MKKLVEMTSVRDQACFGDAMAYHVRSAKVKWLESAGFGSTISMSYCEKQCIASNILLE